MEWLETWSQFICAFKPRRMLSSRDRLEYNRKKMMEEKREKQHENFHNSNCNNK